MLVISVGAQMADENASSVGKHVVMMIGSLTPKTASITVVDTIVETLNVETTDVPNRVAVGVCRQAMRRNYFEVDRW